MPLCNRSWEGLKILLLAKECKLPLSIAPLAIEDLKCQVLTFDKTNLYFFDSYSDALKFCKATKEVGFIIIQEDFHEISFESIFRELSKPYKSVGLPCFGAVLYKDNRHASSSFEISKNTYLLDYISTNDFFDLGKNFGIFERLWDSYINAFEDYLLPRVFQKSLYSLAESELGLAGLHFTSRLVNNFSMSTDLSWIESISFKWSVILTAVQKKVPEIFEGQTTLNYIMEISKLENRKENIDLNWFLRASSTPLQYLVYLVRSLNTLRLDGRLELELEQLIARKSLAEDPIVAHITRYKDHILKFARDAESIGTSNI